MVIVLFRVLYGLWILGLFALIVVALADTIFGEGHMATRVTQLPQRILIAILWPLAILTPRGRYLLWARWRNPF